jgi:hypothetical protein
LAKPARHAFARRPIKIVAHLKRDGGKETCQKEGLLFLKKKKQKNFCSCGPWQPPGQRPQEQKFFWLLFFQKK